jgi:hypothetical protein
MDFSQFTGTEQAHMTKVIEKKQVGFVLEFSARSGNEKRLWRISNGITLRRDIIIRRAEDQELAVMIPGAIEGHCDSRGIPRKSGMNNWI